MSSITFEEITAEKSKTQLITIEAEAQSEPIAIEESQTDSGAPGRPSEFILSKNGVFQVKVDDQKGPQYKRICAPLIIEAAARDANNECWGKLLGFQDPDGREHKILLKNEWLSGDGSEYRKLLLDKGFEIEFGFDVNRLINKYILHSNPAARLRCVNKTGWYDGKAFVLPDKVIPELEEEKIVYQSSYSKRSYIDQKGTLEEWKSNVARYCMGNSRLTFAVSLAFAAPLLTPLDEESGGFNISGPSSTGKTTCLRVASSVYGNHKYVQRWYATANALSSMALNHNDTLLALDELAQLDPKSAGATAYNLANGDSKGRSNRNGEIRDTEKWRLLFLSSGEITLAEHISEANKTATAGQEIRCVDIPADAGAEMGIFENLHDKQNGAELSKHLNSVTNKFYGTAFVNWIAKLATAMRKNAEGTLEFLKKTQREFAEAMLNTNPNASGQLIRVAYRMGLVAAAGTLATKFKLTDWPEDEAMKASAICFQAYFNQRGHDGNQEEAAIIKQVRTFFAVHGDSHFTLIGTNDEKSDTNKITYTRAGFRKVIHERDKEGTEREITEYYALPDAFASLICVGKNHKNAAKVLVKHSIMEPGKSGRTGSKRRLPGIGSTWCYTFRSDKLTSS